MSGKMRLYNYDYDDMRDLTMSLNTNEETQLTSNIYPIKLEVKIDEYVNRPYLYYEGIVQTNKGCMKITFPKLDLVLNTVSYEQDQRYESAYLPFWAENKHHIIRKDYKMTTEFCNLGNENVMFYLQHLSVEEGKEIVEQLWNGVKIVGKDINSKD